MSFWKGESCEYCGGPIRDRRVFLHRMSGRRHIVIENVPAGCCAECGARYYSADVLKAVQAILNGTRKASREIRVPVYSLR